MNTKNFMELTMWQKAHLFVLAVYKVTDTFPKSELFGLTSQFRRAAISIPANQAEGYRRKNAPEKLRFFNISQSSLEECRYYIILSKDLGFISEDLFKNLINLLEDSSRLLNAYYNKVSTNLPSKN